MKKQLLILAAILFEVFFNSTQCRAFWFISSTTPQGWELVRRYEYNNQVPSQETISWDGDEYPWILIFGFLRHTDPSKPNTYVGLVFNSDTSTNYPHMGLFYLSISNEFSAYGYYSNTSVAAAGPVKAGCPTAFTLFTGNLKNIGSRRLFEALKQYTHSNYSNYETIYVCRTWSNTTDKITSVTIKPQSTTTPVSGFVEIYRAK